MTSAVLSIGANLGDRLAHLQTAVDGLRAWVRHVSPVYETAPWGPVPQADYLNAVVLVDDPDAAARAWLTRSQAAEQAAGRIRDTRWGPRTLDVDVIAVDEPHGSVRSSDPEFLLPHPRAHERAFVLLPWLAVDADAVLDETPVAELAAALPAAELGGVRLTDLELR